MQAGFVFVSFAEGDAFEERASELVERKERMFNKFELLTYKEAMVRFIVLPWEETELLMKLTFATCCKFRVVHCRGNESRLRV